MMRPLNFRLHSVLLADRHRMVRARHERRGRMIDKQTISVQVADGLRAMIMDEGLKPGDRLPTEQALADQFGVSRVSVREATKALGYLGIIKSSPRRGLTVGELDMQRASAALGFQFAVSRYPGRWIIQARTVIEVGALAFTMERMAEDPEVYGQLRELALLTEREQAPRAFIDHEIAFHRGLVEASDIEPLVPFTDLLHEFFKRYCEVVVKSKGDGGVKEHRRLVNLLRKGKLVAAEKLLRRHILAFLVLEPDPPANGTPKMEPRRRGRTGSAY